MFRQQHPSSAARHIHTPHDRRELGRDDPVWPCYVKEAEKWDSNPIDGWNKAMDVLLLFAGLFSAVVTAFLIESYKRLQQDSDETTAAGIVQITLLLQAIANKEAPNTPNPTVSSVFQPSLAAVAINTTWFLSLSLSLLVATVGMLVKQWGESYESGKELNPPSVQARIRQSRFDKLKKWRTEDIVLALPVVMHLALGLFYVGLLIFLWDLNHTVALPVIIVVAVSFSFYGLTALLPLVVTFCPYNTPLSSQRLWVFLCWQIWSGCSEDDIRGTGCVQEEKRISENNSGPDEVTGCALDWLIKHSKDGSNVDVAIRAIAGAKLPKEVWDLLAVEDSLIVLVAQRFTALFGGVLDSGAELACHPGAKITNSADGRAGHGQDDPSDSTRDSNSMPVVNSNPMLRLSPNLLITASQNIQYSANQLEKMSLYGRALTNIAKHRRPIDFGAKSEEDPESRLGGVTSVPLTPDQTQAVTYGLYYLSASTLPNIAAYGVVSMSAWYMFTTQTRDNWKESLKRSFQVILAHVTTKNQLHADALTGLMQTLPIEISYWKQDLSKTERKELLLPLVQVLDEDQQVQQVQEGLPLMLAVLALSVNDYPDLYTNDEFRQWEHTYEAYSNLVEIHHQAAKKWKHSPSDYSGTSSLVHDHANRAEWRAWRAQQAALIYTIYPNLRKEYTEPLLLLGLSFLLGSLDVLGLEDKSIEIAKAVHRCLGQMSLLNQSKPITLPLVLPVSFDIRAYAVDCIIQALRPSRYRDQIDRVEDNVKVHLLAAFAEKPRIWIDFGPQITLPAIELLHISKNSDLHLQCLDMSLSVPVLTQGDRPGRSKRSKS